MKWTKVELFFTILIGLFLVGLVWNTVRDVKEANGNVDLKAQGYFIDGEGTLDRDGITSVYTSEGWVNVSAEVDNPYDPESTPEAPQQSLKVESQEDLLNVELEN